MDHVDYDIEKRRLVIENKDLQLVIQFKGDNMAGVVSKNRRLVLENELLKLFRDNTQDSDEFRDHLDAMFGALFMRDLPSEDWKRQAEHLLG